MLVIDANVILRYILNDDEEMSKKAVQYLNEPNAYVTIEVVAEVVYVLKRVYSIDRHTIVNGIKRLLEYIKCQDAIVLNHALDTYANNNLDFIDCVLYGYHSIKKTKIATFDKKLLKIIANE